MGTTIGEAATITHNRRHGGYLISVGTDVPGWDGLTPMESFDCAGSLRSARAAAVEMATSMDCAPPFRLRKDDANRWTLLGHMESDELRYNPETEEWA